MAADLSAEGLDAYQFAFESPRVKLGAQFAAYAAPSFRPGRPLAEALLDFTARIHRDFRFDSKATTVRTEPDEVLPSVAEFARTSPICNGLSALDRLPARYVSGYLRTLPPPGRPRLVGADASHAWVSVLSRRRLDRGRSHE